MRLFLSLALVALPLIAEARICSFDQAVLDDGAISVFNAPYEVEIDNPNAQMITPDGPYDTEGYVGNFDGELFLFRDDERTLVLSALRSGPARMSIHVLKDGPSVETYSGMCDPK